MSPAELHEYAREHPNSAYFLYQCPTCGMSRYLTRRAVMRSTFPTTGYHCRHCGHSDQTESADKVPVVCKKCGKTRWVRKHTSKHKLHSDYCRSCAMRKNENKRKVYKQRKPREAKALPEFCTPIRTDYPCDSKRNVWCQHYNKCLDHTIDNQWPSFGCDICQGYEPEQMSTRYLGPEVIAELFPDYRL